MVLRNKYNKKSGGVMKLTDYVKLLNEETKRILFGFTLRIGDLVDGAFNPNQEIKVQGNSTEEFMANLKRQLEDNHVPPLAKESEQKMWEKLSDLELDFIKRQREFERIAM